MTSLPAPTRAPAPRPAGQMLIGCGVIPVVVVLLIGGFFLWLRAGATAEVIVPPKTILLVRSAPDEAAPLLARFGEGRALPVIGRSDDWRWLAVELWDGRQGWALRPLDILIWRIDAQPLHPTSTAIETTTDKPFLPETMIDIPATTFTMGSPPGLGEADEQPAHPVSLSAFAIDQTEVTVGRYWACVSDGGCTAPPQDAAQTEPHYLNDPAFDNYPIINITWEQARAYCAWRGKRLPTEAEWEAAAGWDAARRAKLLWPWGNTEDAPGPVNINQATNDPTPVGNQPGDISAVGVLDLAGNVSEWVFDWYKVDYYSTADDTDPHGPIQRRGQGTGRVVRGGSFATSLADGRTARRHHQAEGYGYPTVGFRCVQSNATTPESP